MSHAKCFTVDNPVEQIWKDTELVVAAAEFACKEDLAKEYQGHEEAVAHEISPDNTDVFSFKVRRVKDSKRTLGLYECMNGMSKEVRGCPHGGKSKYGNWEYTEDHRLVNMHFV
ncbi:hypothetical protein GGS26DRAFT_594566 [Hypomontagnella submonticulosa]|nr:hypothetical protein GGS26DRAFT_594566 [Hypomontagnella submonticulosa]